MTENRSAGDRRRRRDLYDSMVELAPSAPGLAHLIERLNWGLLIDWDGSAVRVLGSGEEAAKWHATSTAIGRGAGRSGQIRQLGHGHRPQPPGPGGSPEVG